MCTQSRLSDKQLSLGFNSVEIPFRSLWLLDPNIRVDCDKIVTCLGDQINSTGMRRDFFEAFFAFASR